MVLWRIYNMTPPFIRRTKIARSETRSSPNCRSLELRQSLIEYLLRTLFPPLMAPREGIEPTADSGLEAARSTTELTRREH